MSKPRNESEYRLTMKKAVEDCDELLVTFNALLSIAQAEAGVHRDTMATVDLTTLADELADMYQIVAEENALAFHWHKSQNLSVLGNRQLLAQAVSNLLENAIKYTPAGGQVNLGVDVNDDQPVIWVSDTGPGIPAQYRQQVLERFQRLDSARSTPGNGLGLSLVKAVAILHAAVLSLEDNAPGLRVSLTFRLI